MLQFSLLAGYQRVEVADIEPAVLPCLSSFLELSAMSVCADLTLERCDSASKRD